ncbi:MAG: DUF3494 domain-containing protein [Bacteroidales bacterium]|nr:MAG: DUF3494 domain-containing protein [Bacteroidales bacterium]
MKLKNVFAIIAMLLIVLITGCKKDDDITGGVRPNVTSTDPINEATNTTTNSKISATFTVIMDPSTITSESFTLKKGNDVVLGAVEYIGMTAIFTPAEDMAPSTTYTGTITTAAKDDSGKSLAEDYVWSFTTGVTPDITLPTVTLTSPVNNATGVNLNHLVAITFSESMDPLTITTSTFNVKQGTSNVAGAVTYTGRIATFTPASNLLPNKVYTATISTGVKDLAGNALANSYSLSFTTGAALDATAPTITLTDPSNNATGVVLNHKVLITFSEVMNPLTITTTTFTLKQGTTAILGSVTYTGVIATFTPAANLELNKVYTATVTIGVKDLAGNALASNSVISFTTGSTIDAILPTVTLTDPLNNATNVAREKVVALTFSEAMDPLTVNTSTFTLKKGAIVVPGIVAYSGVTATFTPTDILAAGSVYTAKITTGAKDLAGNAIASNTEWSFTTTGTISLLSPVSLGAAGDYVILAKTAINNISTSAITGDIGLSPAATSYITGFALTNATGYATSVQITGKIYAADMAAPTGINLTTAVENMITAYNDAAGRPTPDFLELGTGNIGGKTLIPGLYKWTNTVTIPSDVTISGGANDVWIFQIAGNLEMSSAVHVTLIGGAQPKNIFWQVAGQATFGTTSHFEGIILSMTGITFQTSASMNGRALAQTAVILDANAITKPL